MEKVGTADTPTPAAATKNSLFKHVLVYVGVNTLLLAINLLSSPESLWVIWPMMGWGIAILLHIVSVLIAHFKRDRVAGEREWGRR